MVVCKFYQNGNCRNGANCKFEHRLENNTRNNSNDNRSNGSGGGRAFGNISLPEKWNLNEQDIRNDLTNTRPNWILSAYGPGKETPASLFVDNEFSPEEIRCRFYTHRESGPNQAEGADQEAISLWKKAANDMTEAAGKVSDIQKYMIDKETEHPNRYDFCKMDGKLPREEFAKKVQITSPPNSLSNPFGVASNPSTTSNPFSKPAFGQSGFGVGNSQPSTAFGRPAEPSAFGKPSFGAPAFGQQSNSGFGAAPSNSAFGKPAISGSGFGQTGFGQTAQPAASGFGQQAQPASGFGQVSNPGQSNPNPFAKPTAASGFGVAGAGAGASPFGRPSFGQPASSGFGAPSAAGPAFGQPSFGQPASAGPSPFGQTATAGSSPFGQAAASPAFGQTGFGVQPATSQLQPAFGTPSNAGFGAQTQTAGFGQPAQQSNNTPQQGFGAGFGRDTTAQTQNSMQSGFGTGFGQKTDSTSASSPFGGNQASNTTFGASPFGQTGAQQSSPFGQTPSTQSKSSPFGQPQPMQATTTNSSSPFTPASQQPQPQPPAAAALPVSASKPTTNPVRPLLYAQTLPEGPTTFGPRGELTRFRNCAVDYRRIEEPSTEGEMRLKELVPRYQRQDNGSSERIWFPKGSAESNVQTLSRVLLDLQLADTAYTDEVKAKYGDLFENGRFKDGKVPLVPPMQAWVDRDF